jgi:uncharacterized protein (TIGR02145 family)
MKTKLISLSLILFGVVLAERSLVIWKKDATTKSYLFSEVLKLKFPKGPPAQIVVYKTAGGTDAYNIADVDSFGYTGYETGTMTDIDGNTYQTVKIGNQWWIAQNLKTTHYRNGEAILNVIDGGTWAGLSTGAQCAYGNNEGNVEIYGRLYNWYAVNDGRNIAPSGWHVLSDEEWQTLIDYLGGSGVAGGKMKTTTGWNSPNTGATNSSGFSALPGGLRNGNGDFLDMSYFAHFWSSSECSSNNAWDRDLSYGNESVVHDNYGKDCGFSVRCVKD